MAKWNTVQEAAAEYVFLMVDQKPNGWGQYVHPVHGQSHNMLFKIATQFGYEDTEAAVSAAFEKRREQKANIPPRKRVAYSVTVRRITREDITVEVKAFDRAGAASKAELEAQCREQSEWEAYDCEYSVDVNEVKEIAG